MRQLKEYCTAEVSLLPLDADDVLTFSCGFDGEEIELLN